MAAPRIIEHLDIVEDILPGVGSGCVGFSPDPLCLEKMEEALRHSIIVAVPPPAHARQEPVSI